MKLRHDADVNNSISIVCLILKQKVADVMKLIFDVIVVTLN